MKWTTGALLLLLLTGCSGTIGSLANRVAGDDGDPLMLENEKAVVAKPSRPLKEEGDAPSGQVLRVRVGGVDIPALCAGTIEETCRRFLPLDPIWIDEAVWKSGLIDGSQQVYIEIIKTRKRQ